MKKLILLFVAFLPICLFSQVQIGDTEYASLNEACDAAVDGDVVTIAGETTLEVVYGIGKNITVKGVTTDAKILMGEGDARLGFEGEGTVITVQDLTIVGYPRSQRQMWTGGSCIVKFINDTIRDCWNTGPNDEHGGAFLLTGTSTVEAYNTVFKDNYSSKNGGVFWAVDQCNVKLYDCLLTGNIAQYQHEDGKGGVLASVGEGHTYYAENCAFIANGSEGHGGAIWIEHNQTMTCVNCTFSQNWAGGNGGAIGFWENASVNLINCTVYGNTVTNPGSGGAIFMNWASNTVNMQNTVLTSNGYDDGSASGPSNIEGNPENAPYTVTADNSYYTLTEDGTITTEGANSINSGATLLSEVDLESGILWNEIAAETSVLVGLGDPSYLTPYTTTDQRGWERDNIGSAICAGAWDLDATPYDSVVVKKQIEDQIMESISELSVSYDGVMEIYMVPVSLYPILGEVEYDEDIEVSDPDALSAVLNTDDKTIDLTKTTEDEAVVTVTLTGWSAVAANNQVSFDVYLNRTNGLNAGTINEIAVYPNPAADYIVLQNEFSSAVNITVYNVAGEAVINTELQSSRNKLDVSSLNSGMYFIKISEENGTIYSQRFIKE